MAALVIAEHDNASIRGATLSTVTAAIQCGGDVHVLAGDTNAAEAAKAASQIAGVAIVIHADGAQFEHGLAENVAAQVLALASNYSHILFPGTAAGKNIAPRVAAKLDVAQISDVIKVDSADTFERPIYAGNAIATVQSSDAVKVITVRTTRFDPAPAGGGSATIETMAGVAASDKVTYMGGEIARNDRPELTAAKVIVSGGRAPGLQREVHAGHDTAGRQAGSRRGCLARGRGCRLRTQRLANRADRQDRGPPLIHRLRHQRGHPAPGGHEGFQGDRRNNQDPEAPIFSVADYGLEADLFQAVPELVRAL